MTNREMKFAVYVIFLVAMIVALVGGILYRDHQTSNRNNEITRLLHENELLRAAQEPSVPSPDLKASLFFEAAKSLLAFPEYHQKSFTELLITSEKLSKTATITLVFVDPTKKWERLRELGHDPLTREMLDLSQRYPLNDIIAGKPTPLIYVTIPEKLTLWDTTYWFTFYIIYTVLFVGIWLIMCKFVDEPIFSYPLNSVGPALIAIFTAPTMLPLAMIFGVFKFLNIDWMEALVKLQPKLRHFAYQARLIRRLPAPILERVTLPTMRNANPATQNHETGETTAVAEIQTDDTSPLWYALEGTPFIGLTHLLIQEGVELFDGLPLTEPEKMECYAVPADAMQKFERVLRIDDRDKKTDTETNIERTVLRQYKQGSGCIKINMQMQSKSDMQDVLEVVSRRANNATLTLRHFENYDVLPSLDEKIYIYMLCESCTPSARLTSIYGRTLQRPIPWKTNADNRGVFITDQNGNRLAQIVGNAIYILVDFISYLRIQSLKEKEIEWAYEVFARLLHESIEECQKQMRRVEDDDERAQMWRKAAEKNREYYTEACFTRLVERKNGLEKLIEDTKNSITIAANTITRKIVQLREDERQLDAFVEKEFSKEKDRLKKEFDELFASKYVIAIEADQKGINVYTKTIYITHNNKRYRIGRFRIHLSLEGHISFENLTNTAQKTSFLHPHVRSGNQPCFGNLAESLAELMAERQYAIVINMVFRFLENYNYHGGVENITHWEEVTDEKTVE